MKLELVITDRRKDRAVSDGEKSVSVPAELYSRLSSLLGKTGAGSIDELVVRIIRDWVSKEVAKESSTKPSQLTAEDEKVVEDRLKALGYM